MKTTQLSRRERQIMDSLYRRGRANVLDIQADLPDAPTDSAIRAMLRLLEAKGHVRRQSETRPHVYRPRIERDEAGRGACEASRADLLWWIEGTSHSGNPLNLRWMIDGEQILADFARIHDCTIGIRKSHANRMQ